MPKVRSVTLYGALGDMFSEGMNKLYEKAHYIPGCTSSCHYYGGLFGLYQRRGFFRDLIISAWRDGRAIVAAGHSLGGDTLVKALWDVYEADPSIKVEYALICDPTPLVWTAPPNVRTIMNPYNNVVGNLGGGKMRRNEKYPYGSNSLITEVRQIVHVRLDNIVEYHDQYLKAINSLRAAGDKRLA